MLFKRDLSRKSNKQSFLTSQITIIKQFIVMIDDNFEIFNFAYY